MIEIHASVNLIPHNVTSESYVLHNLRIALYILKLCPRQWVNLNVNEEYFIKTLRHHLRPGVTKFQQLDCLSNSVVEAHA